MKCFKCNYEISGTFKFCPECGTPAGCPKCHYHGITPGMKFCPECGFKLSSTDAKESANNSASTSKMLVFVEEEIFYKLIGVVTVNIPQMIDKSNIKKYSCDFITYKNKFIEELLEVINFKFNFYNHLISTVIGEKNQKYLVSSDFVRAQNNKDLNFIETYLNHNNSIFQQFAQKSNYISAISSEIANQKDNMKLKGGIIAGVAGLATIATGGLLAPIMATAGLGSSLIMDDKKKEQLEQNRKEAEESLRALENKISNILESLLNDIISQQIEFLKSSFLTSITDIFNNIINDNVISKDQFLINYNKYHSIFIQCINNNNNRMNIIENIKKFYRLDYDKIKDNLHWSTKTKLMDELDLLRKNCLSLDENYIWYKLKFNLDTKVADINQNILKDIIEKYRNISKLDDNGCKKTNLIYVTERAKDWLHSYIIKDKVEYIRICIPPQCDCLAMMECSKPIIENDIIEEVLGCKFCIDKDLIHRYHSFTIDYLDNGSYLITSSQK